MTDKFCLGRCQTRRSPVPSFIQSRHWLVFLSCAHKASIGGILLRRVGVSAFVPPRLVQNHREAIASACAVRRFVGTNEHRLGHLSFWYNLIRRLTKRIRSDRRFKLHHVGRELCPSGRPLPIPIDGYAPPPLILRRRGSIKRNNDLTWGATFVDNAVPRGHECEFELRQIVWNLFQPTNCEHMIRPPL
jgi:hypothetical protein